MTQTKLKVKDFLKDMMGYTVVQFVEVDGRLSNVIDWYGTVCGWALGEGCEDKGSWSTSEYDRVIKEYGAKDIIEWQVETGEEFYYGRAVSLVISRR